ncbi:MAG: O-antigen ligase family protein [Solirubrobacteraceae bacterium]
MAEGSTGRARVRLGVSLGAFLLVVLIGNADGGYFPTAWGWSALALAWIAGLALLLTARATVGGRLELAFLTSLLLLIAWTALSSVWSSDVEQSVLEVQRGLVYVAGVLAGLLLVREVSVPHLLGGVLTGIVWISLQALSSRLFPPAPRPETDGMLFQARLAGPISYANGLGLLAVMGVFLALGFALHGRSLPARAAAAAAMPVLLTTTYFTFSRGAAAAMAVGLLAAIAIDPRRLTTLSTGVLVALPSAAAVWLASRSPALTSVIGKRSLVAAEGRELALELVALSLGAAAIAIAAWAIERRVGIPRSVRRGFGLALSCIALVAVVGLVVDRGGPVSIVERAYDSLNRDISPTDPGDPNDRNRRLSSLGSTPRVNFWRVAWTQHEQHPWIGAGAGTYEQFWLRYRPGAERARDGHSLYLETLGQLGWPGLLLVLTMLLLPVAGAVRARAHPLVGATTGAYVAYLAHTGVDWDWELPAITLVALLCAVALLAAGQGRSAPAPMLTPRGRAAGLAATVAIALFALIGLFGNHALAQSDRALHASDPRGAQEAARSAARWAPWSAEAHHAWARAAAGLGLGERATEHLRTAVRMNPYNWRIWFDLGTVTSGQERRRAFGEAAALSPLAPEISALRKRGYRLPPPRKSL